MVIGHFWEWASAIGLAFRCWNRISIDFGLKGARVPGKTRHHWPENSDESCMFHAQRKAFKTWKEAQECQKVTTMEIYWTRFGIVRSIAQKKCFGFEKNIANNADARERDDYLLIAVPKPTRHSSERVLTDLAGASGRRQW